MVRDAAKSKENTDIVISNLVLRIFAKEKLHVGKFQCINLLTMDIMDHIQLT